jgi:transposase
VRAEGNGKPLAFVVSLGQHHECRDAATLLDTGVLTRPGRGRPRRRPERAAGDKGYRSPHVRAALRRRGIGAVIPTRSDQRRRPHFDRDAYCTRERVERLIGRLKQCRRVATRYEKRGHHSLAFVTLAAITLWLPV